MKTYIKLTTLALMLFGGLYSCNDEKFLDVDNVNLLPSEQFSNPEAAPELVNAVYDQMQEWGFTVFSWIGLSSITTDDADKGSDPGDTGADKHLMDALTFTSATLSIEEIWKETYKGIARANQALFYLPTLEIDDTFRNRLIGETRFLRGLFYFRLVKMFGGVPLMDKVPDPQNNEDKINARTRASREEVYELIVEDLTFASENLPTSYDSSDLGRATKGAALGLLAKVNLYLRNYQEAYDVSLEVMSMGYSLTSDYSHIWREIGENNNESLFEIQGRGGDVPDGQGDYAATQGARGAGGWGWGFNTPSLDLYNAYEPGDLRRDATIITKDITLWDGRYVPNTVANDRYNYKAYVSESMETNGNNDGKNIRILRYADVLLINAEAANEIGQDAITPLNLVRQRAGLGGTTAVSQSELRLAIWQERRVELAMEHDRWFDLIRQGRAGEVMRAHGNDFVDGKHELFPIPDGQINASGGLLTQNPMW